MTDNPFLLPPGSALSPGATPPPKPDPPATPVVWTIVLPDGTRIPVQGTVLLGRDPARLPGDLGARLVTLDDPGRTVSKTHALLGPVRFGGPADHNGPADHDPVESGTAAAPTGAGIRVRDLYSTNGIAVTSGGVRTVLPSGGEGAADAGSVIELGAFAVRVVLE